METVFSGLVTALLFPLAFFGAVPVFIYVYAILRWRAGSREEPGMGSYSLVLMFRLIAALLGLGALSMLVYALLSDRNTEELTRICWPLLVASLVILVVQFVVGSMLDPVNRFTEARRIFGGGLVAVTGIVTFGALAALLVTLWQDVPADSGSLQARNHADQLNGFGAWLVCFGAVYLASAIRMARAAGLLAPRTRHGDPSAP